MIDIDTALHDAILTQSIDLHHFTTGEQVKVIALLNEAETEIKGMLQRDTLSEIRRADLERLLSQIDETLKTAYDYAAVETSTPQLLSVVAQSTAKALAVIPVSTAVALPTEGLLKQIASEILIQGAPSAAWWARQAEDTTFKFSNQIRLGMTLGETNEQIVRRVAGGRTGGGVMEVAKNNARALVHTSIQTVANEARKATYNANADLISALQWITALDTHVCYLCLPRADLKWTLAEEPIGHDIPFLGGPPIHFADRCVIVPVRKTLRELGIDVDEPAPGARASDTGQIAASTTFNDYLGRRGTAWQDETLGPGRAQLWRDGKITLQDLIDANGKVRTLDELRAL